MMLLDNEFPGLPLRTALDSYVRTKKVASTNGAMDTGEDISSLALRPWNVTGFML